MITTLTVQPERHEMRMQLHTEILKGSTTDEASGDFSIRLIMNITGASITLTVEDEHGERIDETIDVIKLCEQWADCVIEQMIYKPKEPA